MSRTYIRFFGGFLTLQEWWLNKMARRGYRLVHTTKATYTFVPCRSGEYQYCVEFIGEKSRRSAQEYRAFLEEMGYKVFYKNINLNYSVGKVRWRPWAQSGGQLATHATTFDRELLIVEKKADGKPFALHTTYADRMAYIRRVQRPWLCFLVLSALGYGLTRAWAWGVFAALCLAVVLAQTAEWLLLRRQAKTEEW